LILSKPPFGFFFIALKFCCPHNGFFINRKQLFSF